MVFSIELILTIISLIMMGTIFITLYRFRKVPGVVYMMSIVICRIVYASSLILEKSSYLLAEKIFFRNIQQTSLVLMIPCFVMAVYLLINRQKTPKAGWKIALFSIFIFWLLLIWLNPYLHIVYHTSTLVDGQLLTVRTLYASSFNIFCYAILTICFYHLYSYVRTIRSDFRKPGMFVLLLTSLPFVLEMIRFANPKWSTQLGTLSTFCSVTGLLILIIILKTKFFAIVPITKHIVFDRFPESIIIMNASSDVMESNVEGIQFFKDLGYSDIYNQKASELLTQWPAWYRLTHEMQQGVVDIEVWVHKVRKIYRVHVYPLQIGQGSVSLLIDITEQQQQAEEIAYLNKLKDQLVAVVSHDIRSPLAMQYQLIELLEEDRAHFATDHQEIITKLGEQIRHTLDMSNNLLEWFRSQRDDVALRPQTLQLANVVEECCQLIALHCEMKNLHVVNNIVKDTYVYADREVVSLVLRNLLSNAIKFTQAGGTIHINAQLSGEMVIVSVRDNGLGMEQQQLEQLFNGHQIPSTVGTAGEKGAGLGLLVSKQFIQLSGESIWAESSVGQGSVFYFTLRGGE
ncbi:sensor histidine kinase [Bacillus ndiopicus]|uniref:sensor histidine kinase n=1 Tax=Bacillus ndiopicus TaxID=1347368 RepID=UPI0005A81642|nr:sensor histidine kinase [Bacillus ndiopicus]